LQTAKFQAETQLKTAEMVAKGMQWTKQKELTTIWWMSSLWS
jgi:hypothetical protein